MLIPISPEMISAQISLYHIIPQLGNIGVPKENFRNGRVIQDLQQNSILGNGCSRDRLGRFGAWPVKFASFPLHGQCTHAFSWVVLYLI